MRKKKILLLLTFAMLLLFTLTGCNDKGSITTEVLSKEPLGYLLTSKDGHITGFYRDGKDYMKTKIGNNNSDFIYTIDEGELFHHKIKDETFIPGILYALDKNKSTITILKVNNDKIEKVNEVNVKNGQKIDKMRAFNGKLYYSINDSGLKAKKHSFKKDDNYKNSGITDFNVSLPKKRSSAIKTYIVIEDLTDEFKQIVDLDLTDEEYNDLNVKKERSSIIEIPYLIDDWSVSDKDIYFFVDGFMGQYNLEKDLISIYFGSKKGINSFYIPGIDKKVISLSDLGENGNKSVLLELDPKYMQVEKAIEFPEGEPLGFDVVKNKHALIAFRNMNKDAKTLSRLNVVKYDDYEKVSTIPVEYVPTKVVGKGDLVALFNPNEDYFLFGGISSKKMSKYKTVYDNINYTDVFMFDFIHESDYNYDKDGNLLNKKNQRVDEDGNLLNKEEEKINAYGQLLDEFNRPINAKGEFIDRYNNVIDEDGNIIKLVKGTDGYYRNSFGNFVNKKGEKLIQTKNGDWIDPSEVKKDIEIEGFYDSDGTFKIKPEILREFPEAKGKLEKSLTDDKLKEKEEEDIEVIEENNKPKVDNPNEPKVISTPDKIEYKEDTKSKTNKKGFFSRIFKK